MKTLSELQGILLKYCQQIDIYYALVILNRKNGEITLSPTIEEAFADPLYCVLEARRTDTGFLIREIMDESIKIVYSV